MDYERRNTVPGVQLRTGPDAPLFTMRAQSTRQFALYRLTSATAEQIFVSGVIE